MSVHLDAFVTHDGITTTTHLVADGPINCCTPPSGGFTYTGSHSFDVVAGDTYGFTMGGLNFDSTAHFYGTLTLTDSPYNNPAAVASNTSWTTAAPLTTAGLDGVLTQPGEARWYKFPVQPDSQVQVDLGNLDQNFDLTMFRDIGQAFTTLTTTQDLTKLSAQFAGDAYSPSIYSPSIYSPSIYSPSIYSPSIYSPSIYSPSIYSPSIYSPSIYSPSIYSHPSTPHRSTHPPSTAHRSTRHRMRSWRHSRARRPAASSVSRPTRTPNPNPFGPRLGTTPATSTCASRVATARSRQRHSTSICRRPKGRARPSCSTRSARRRPSAARRASPRQ